MRPSGLKLSARHRAWLYGSFAALWLSGALWLAVQWYRWQSAHAGHDVQQLARVALQTHGAAAMAALVLLGTLIPLHMKRGWQADRNRRNGLALIVANGVLIVTGYGLYYAGGERLRAVSQWTHSVLGMWLPLLIVWHIRAGRLTRPRRS